MRPGRERDFFGTDIAPGNVQIRNLFHHSSKCIIACHEDEDIACHGDEDIKSIVHCVMVCECLHFRRV